MTQPSTSAILEVEGVLREVLPDVFRQRLPAMGERLRGGRVRMLVTTLIGPRRVEAMRTGAFFRPARDGRAPEFTWKSGGALNDVIRQFRLDFLRHLGQAELVCPIYLAVWLEADAPPQFESAPASQPASPAPPADADHRLMRRAIMSHRLAPHEGSALPDGVAASLAQEAPAPRFQAEPARVIDATPAPQAGPSEEELPSPTPPPRRHEPLVGHSPIALPGNFYQDFFGFERMPFNNTPDTMFYFPSQKHQEALSRLIYAISERKGFVMISGEIGAGKSTLCRTLLSQLPGDVKTALITHTHLDGLQLVQAIAEDLGVDAHGLSRYETLQRLNAYLIDQLAEGSTVVIIIDEAQNLTPEALEEVRMVSNLETEQEKLIQLILLGQPNLREKVQMPSLYQLRQRIAVQFHLEPLSPAETAAYIRHRLDVAKPDRPLQFKASAMREVYRWSGGVPRLINTLCDNALLTAFTRQRRKIVPALIQEAAHDLDLSPRGLMAGAGGFFKFW